MSAITHLYAGVPVTDLHASIEWYTRLFGRGPDVRAGDELLWEIEEHATLFVEPDSARAGTGRITLSVVGSTRSSRPSLPGTSTAKLSRLTPTASAT